MGQVIEEQKEVTIESLQAEISSLKETLGAIQKNTEKPLFINPKLNAEFEKYQQKYADDPTSLEIMYKNLKSEDR